MTRLDISPIFIVGHPRSGTTWLTELLGAHPRLATGTETHLFDFYLERLFKERDTWLWDWVDDATLDRLIGEFVTAIFQAKLDATGKRRIVEKTPTHRYWIESILALFPEARIVHCIRDGRDVALSMLARREKTGEAWIPGTLEACAESWRKSIELVGQWRKELGGEVLVESRFEEMLRTPESHLGRLLEKLDEKTAPEELRDMISRQPVLPGRLERWRHELTSEQQQRFVDVAGAMLERLGYPE